MYSCSHVWKTIWQRFVNHSSMQQTRQQDPKQQHKKKKTLHNCQDQDPALKLHQFQNNRLSTKVAAFPHLFQNSSANNIFQRTLMRTTTSLKRTSLSVLTRSQATTSTQPKTRTTRVACSFSKTSFMISSLTRRLSCTANVHKTWKDVNSGSSRSGLAIICKSTTFSRLTW